MIWKTTDHTGKPTTWYSKEFVEEIKQFCRDRIGSSNYNLEYQCACKVLLEHIEKKENNGNDNQ